MPDRSLRLALPTLVLALAVALASCSEPHDPNQGRTQWLERQEGRSAQDGPTPAELDNPGSPTPGAGRINVLYAETDDYELLEEALAGSGVFEGMAEAVTSVVVLPRDLQAVFAECGTANAFYSDGQIVMCYEFFDLFARIFVELSPDDPDAVYKGVLSAGGFFFLHELGHALVDQLQIPITGREEDSVDALAGLILILGGSEGAVWQAVQQFNAMGVASETEGFRPYWGEHSLDLQRQYDLACMVYGSDPEAWSQMVSPDLLPIERAERCPREFWQKAISWDRLLAPHYQQNQPPELLAWPLSCDFFPPEGEPLAHCARREPDGEIVLGPGVLRESGDPAEIHVVIVNDELLFALASGKTAPALPFDNGVDYFVEGLARTVRDGKIGFVDERLELIVPRQWDFAFPFEGGFARVCSGCWLEHQGDDEHATVVGGAWGIIGRNGGVVVPVEHEWEDLPEL